jgi:hypothetical protein
MEDGTIEINLPGEFDPMEEAILNSLYEHPRGDIGVKDLVRILKPEHTTAEQQEQDFEEVQHGIETLIVARLVRGQRVSESGKVRHDTLRLTRKGEAEAIKQRRREKKITVSMVRIGDNTPRPDRDS